MKLYIMFLLSMIQFHYMKKDSGFIQIIVLVIIFVVVAYYFGKDPITLWEKIRPLFEFIFDLFIKIIDFIIKLVAAAWQTTQN